MKSSTLIAIIIGFASIFGAFYWEGGSFDTLFLLPPMLIVFGGTLAAGVAGTSYEQFKRMPKLIALSWNPPKYDIEKIISRIVIFAAIARREGILSIETKLNEVEHPFLKKLFQICIDGADPETLKEIVDSEILHITERHEANIQFFTKMGGYSPTMGIIGTVMGLIATLAAAGDDPNVLIHHIASAFIATMWGILMANMFWFPIGDKLRTMHDEEMSLYQVMLDGVNGVQLGETPTVIRAKLISAFPISQQEEYLSRQKIATDKAISMKVPSQAGIVQKNEKSKKDGKPAPQVGNEVRINPIPSNFMKKK